MAGGKRQKKTNWNNLTLKEKYQRHWETKSFQPSDRSVTIFGMSFVWINTVSLVVEGFTLLLPHFFSAAGGGGWNPGLFLSKVATVYLFLGTAFQWWFLRDVSADKVCKSTSDRLSRDNGLPQGRCDVENEYDLDFMFSP